MSYRVVDNDDDRFVGWQLIETVKADGSVSSRSWASEDIPIESRLNLDEPVCADKRSSAPQGQQIRWVMPSAEVALLLGVDYEELQSSAISRGLDISTETQKRVDVGRGNPSHIVNR